MKLWIRDQVWNGWLKLLAGGLMEDLQQVQLWLWMTRRLNMMLLLWLLSREEWKFSPKLHLNIWKGKRFSREKIRPMWIRRLRQQKWKPVDFHSFSRCARCWLCKSWLGTGKDNSKSLRFNVSEAFNDYNLIGKHFNVRELNNCWWWKLECREFAKNFLRGMSGVTKVCQIYQPNFTVAQIT